MKRLIKLLILDILMLLCVALPACSPRHRPVSKEHVHAQPHRAHALAHQLDNGQYAYQDPSSQLWFYMWMLHSNSNTVQYVERSAYSPADLGRAVVEGGRQFERAAEQEPIEGEQLAEPGAIEAQDLAADQAVEAENATIDAENASAIESFENEGGNTGPDSDSTPSDSSSDSGGDSGGGDSGGSSD